MTMEVNRKVRTYFQGKTVLLTGGSSGIGYSLAQGLRLSGAGLILRDAVRDLLRREYAPRGSVSLARPLGGAWRGGPTLEDILHTDAWAREETARCLTSSTSSK